jgi:hypothetical protein
MALTDTALRNAKPTDKAYKLYDEKGLYLIVNPNGGKWWRLKYRFNDKEKTLSLGTYPEISLASARAKRDEARTLVAEDKDPSEARKYAKAQAKLEAVNNFEAVANEWHALHNKSKSERHQQRVKRWLSPALLFIIKSIMV